MAVNLGSGGSAASACATVTNAQAATAGEASRENWSFMGRNGLPCLPKREPIGKTLLARGPALTGDSYHSDYEALINSDKKGRIPEKISGSLTGATARV